MKIQIFQNSVTSKKYVTDIRRQNGLFGLSLLGLTQNLHFEERDFILGVLHHDTREGK